MLLSRSNSPHNPLFILMCCTVACSSLFFLSHDDPKSIFPKDNHWQPQSHCSEFWLLWVFQVILFLAPMSSFLSFHLLSWLPNGSHLSVSFFFCPAILSGNFSSCFLIPVIHSFSLGSLSFLLHTPFLTALSLVTFWSVWELAAEDGDGAGMRRWVYWTAIPGFHIRVLGGQWWKINSA